MTRVARISINQMYFTTDPDRRVADVSTALEIQRANRRAATDPIDRENAERNVADLEATLERAEVNLKAHNNHIAKLEAERTAQRDTADKAALDAQVDQLKANYLSQPGATVKEFESALPDLLAEHRKQAVLNAPALREQQLAEARRRIGSML